MSPPAETPSPPVGSIRAGYWDIRGRVHGWRPKGTRDWLLIYTESGRGVIRFGENEYHAEAGDIIHYRPGTSQDYGQHDPAGRWKHVWIHWLPRVEFLEGPAWPELFPGVGHLRLAPAHRGIVRRELALADAAMRSDSPRRELMATNAVERAFLHCERAIPGRRVSRWQPGIHKAVDHMASHLRAETTVGEMARRCGYSRSRFAALFREQTGQPPMRYLESLRLAQARQLLEYTNQTLGQIADHTGFACPFYLSQRFKKHFGLSPRSFRKETSRR
jgi:AraC family transcriptional regulator, arabinose operon regulatory protein